MIDEARVAWEEVDAFDVRMDAPAALAAFGKRAFVIGDRLVAFNAEGKATLVSEPFGEPYEGIALDESGRIFAVVGARVDRLAMAGDSVSVDRSVTIEEDAVNLLALAVANDGIYVADARGRRVFRLPKTLQSEEGAAWELFAEKFMVPSETDIAVSPDGDPVTVDPGRHTVQVRDSYGDVVRSFGRLGGKIDDFHGCCNPIAIVMGPDGSTVTAEKGMGVTRVKVYDAEGKLESIVAAPQQFDEPKDGPPIVLDVALDDEGRIFVLDPIRKQVRVFTRKTGDDR